MRVTVALALALSAPSGAGGEAGEVLPTGFPTRRGVFAFTSAEVLAHPEEHASDLAWLSNFDLLLANGVGVAGPETLASLHDAGCKLFLYFWANGLYAGPQPDAPPYGDWATRLLSDRPQQLLAGEPLPSLAGQPAYYFDLGSHELVAYLSAQLASARAATGYDGLFFDYAGSYALPPEVAQVWQDTHPDVPYDRAVVMFLRRFRQRDPDALIFTNQAYRSTEETLAEVDYDLAESYATSFAWGPEMETPTGTVSETYFRPWPGQFGLEGMYGACEDRLRATPPRRGFLYLDYARPQYRRTEGGELQTELDLEAVYYSYCASALWGRASFCSGWYSRHEYRGPLYFADLGRPEGEGPEELDGMVVREYERGLVALMTGTDAAEVDYTLSTGADASLYDLFASKWLPTRGRRVKLRLTPSHSDLSGTARPVGRVYLKAQR